MFNVLKGDKVVLLRAMDELKLVGETFEVANITETAVILRDIKTKIAVGAVNIDNFDEYFSKEFKGFWTPWSQLVDSTGGTLAFYRTNHKKVQVRTTDGKFRSEASCNIMDDFNLFFGIRLAYIRCQNKVLANTKRKHMAYVKVIDEELSENNKTMIQMIDSLSKKNNQDGKKNGNADEI